MSPLELYSIIKPAVPVSDQDTPFAETPNASFGKQSIASICKRYNLTQTKVMAALNNSNPMLICEILEKIAQKRGIELETKPNN
jgi:hypothetical protein